MKRRKPWIAIFQYDGKVDSKIAVIVYTNGGRRSNPIKQAKARMKMHYGYELVAAPTPFDEVLLA